MVFHECYFNSMIFNLMIKFTYMIIKLHPDFDKSLMVRVIA